jgi:hypothetical protein
LPKPDPVNSKEKLPQTEPTIPNPHLDNPNESNKAQQDETKFKHYSLNEKTVLTMIPPSFLAALRALKEKEKFLKETAEKEKLTPNEPPSKK